MIDFRTDPNFPKPTRAEAARFLGHATIGYSLVEVDNLVSIGYAAWFDTQFNIPNTKYTGHFDWLKTKRPWTDGSNVFLDYHLTDSCLRRFVEGGDTLRQKLTFALSQILVVSISVDLGVNWKQYLGAAYLDLLQANAFGDYKTLLLKISQSPVMARFLTFLGSAKSGDGNSPDENYARELMQLFTLGVENLGPDGSVMPGAPYDRKDISELARVFTGWEQTFAEYPPMEGQDRSWLEDFRAILKNNADKHDQGDVTLNLGALPRITVPNIAGGTDPLATMTSAITLIFGHSNVAPFVSRQLIQRLVTSNPSPAYIGRVAAVFQNNGSGVKGDLKAVVQAILMDESLFDANKKRIAGFEATNTTFGKVREPFSRLVHWARAFGATSTTGKWATGNNLSNQSQLAQAPMMAPSVFNFYRPGYVPPSSATAVKRNPDGIPDSSVNGKSFVSPEMQITDEVTTVAYLNFMTRVIDSARGVGDVGDVKSSYSAWLPKASNPAGLVTDLNLLLTAGRLTSVNQTRITNAIATMPSSTDDQRRKRIQAAILMVMASPEYIVQK